MARMLKGSRPIEVGGVRYRWRATGDSGFIQVSIWPVDEGCAGVYCNLPYDESHTANGRLHSQIVVTPRIIRRILEYAVDSAGFDPRQQTMALDLRNAEQAIDWSDAERARR